MKTIQEIYDFASNAHNTRLIKVNPYSYEVPYGWHLLRVMLRLGPNATYREKAVALLHDILEDTDVSIGELSDFIQDPQIVEDVILCSDNYFPDLSKKEKMEYLSASRNFSVIRVKHADIYDNLGFERMSILFKILSDNYAQKPESQREKKYARNIAPYEVLARVNKITSVEDPEQFRTPKGYPTYYDMLNILQSHEINRVVSKEIISGEFTDLLKIRELLTYLPQHEKGTYMDKQNLDAWHFNGTLTWLTSSTGQKYFGVEISPDYFDECNTYLTSLGLQEHITNKIFRDNDKYHITIVGPKDVKYLYKNNQGWTKELNEFVGQQIMIPFYGIGKAEKPRKDTPAIIDTAYFGVVSHPIFSQIREKLALPNSQDFHVTLGFKDKDVFEVSKGVETVFCTPIKLHEVLYPDHKLTPRKKRP